MKKNYIQQTIILIVTMLTLKSYGKTTIEMKPEEINEKFAAAFNTGKLENILKLYEKKAIVHSSPTQADQGHAKIAAGLKGFLAIGGRMIAQNTFVSTTGNIALLRANWKLEGAKKPDGSPLEIGGTSIEVVRKQPNGSWLYVIDQPFGQ